MSEDSFRQTGAAMELSLPATELTAVARGLSGRFIRDEGGFVLLFLTGPSLYREFCSGLDVANRGVGAKT
jgi:hypothetical protein